MIVIASPCRTAPVDLGRVGEAQVSYDASRGLSGIEVAINGVRFRPLAGAAALGPAGAPDPSIPVSVQPEVDGEVLRVAITGPSQGTPTEPERAKVAPGNSTHSNVWNSPLSGIDPGLVQGLDEWRRLDLSRYSEPYGQTWWPKTTYSAKGDFWFTAHWVMEESDGTRWKATNESNRGTEPFPAALQVVYEPDTAGNYLPLREVLELRFSKHLWDVVPVPRQKPSEYRDFLTKSVFVDLWGGQPASELKHLLEVLKAISRGKQSYYTVLQNWEVGGWDALLPDSMWLPDYQPNPSVGTVQELRELCTLAKSMGRFGFRTNYRILRDYSPSYRRGLAHFALGADGKPLDYLRCADWLPVATRGDREIAEQFAPDACFTDQMTSGAAPWSWHDWAAEGGSRSMRQTLKHQQALARSMKETLGGPLGSETLSDQHLLGEFVDTGDFGVKNGHSRLFSPEYKLRRLQHLSGFHSMGLMYRFYEMPPFERFHSGTTTFGNDDAQLDDYRAAEILYGNGGYVCHDFANWRYYLTECLLVGHLQQYYSGQPVQAVRYWHNDDWVTLEALVRQGTVPNIVPWNPQTKAYGRIRVEYANGLTIVVNRLDEEFTVDDTEADPLVLPRSGWVAWTKDGNLHACSAYWPETKHRVDYLTDDNAGLVYIDPRGRQLLGVSAITLWDHDRVVLTADPDHNTVTVDGKTLQLEVPSPPPRTALDFRFDDGLGGWRPARGILAAEARNGSLLLRIVAPGAFLTSPPLKLDASGIPAIEIRMKLRAEGAKPGGLYFTTEEFPNVWNDKLFNFEVAADGEWHTYRLGVSANPKWQGTITGLRLDPLRGAMEAEVEIDSIRAAGS
jgi:hypothetical protein